MLFAVRLSHCVHRLMNRRRPQKHKRPAAASKRHFLRQTQAFVSVMAVGTSRLWFHHADREFTRGVRTRHLLHDALKTITSNECLFVAFGSCITEEYAQPWANFYNFSENICWNFINQITINYHKTGNNLISKRVHSKNQHSNRDFRPSKKLFDHKLKSWNHSYAILRFNNLLQTIKIYRLKG
jgi:hypothetical protein